MKKTILFAWIASLVLILGGCGSNDKIDTENTSTSYNVVEMQAAPIVPDGLDFTLNIPVVKTVDSQYDVVLKDFELSVTGCELARTISAPSSLEIKGDRGATEILDISGVFSTNCTPTKYILTYTQTVSNDSQSRTETLTFDSSDLATSGGSVETSGYYFSNTNSPLEISVANKGYQLKIQLAKDSFIVSGETINIHVFDNMYGDLTSYSATTGSDGYAVFEYTSPDPLPANGTMTSIQAEYKDENNNSITKDFFLTFNSEASTTEDLDTTLPVAIVPTTQRTVTLTSNGQSVDIAIKVYKDTAPYTTGEVKVELPSEVLDGVDVGLFSAYSVPVDSQGVALFHYTGPNNLQALIDDNHLSSTFKFYHSENTDDESRQPMTVVYQPDDSYVPMDYRMVITTQNDDFSMGIPELTKAFNIVLQKSDGSDLADGDATITSVTVQTENASVAQLYDTTNNTLVDSLVLQNVQSSSFFVKSKTLSGIVPIRAKIEFNDVNGDAKVLETIVNVRVMSGPPSAISISYVSTGQDVDRAKYIERFAISATDEYGNNVNTRPYISLGAIAGYTVDGREADGNETNETKRLFYGRDDILDGTASGFLNELGDSDPHTTQFEAEVRPDVFKYVNEEGPNTDKLVVFGAGKNYEAMGKWDFSRIGDTLLNLEDDYYGEDRHGLYYAIGHNYYQDQCRQDGREWTGNAASETYQLDDEGTVLIEYKYDYHLSGKDVMVWVNLDGIQPDTGEKTRIGEATKHTLRTAGLTKEPSAGYSLEKNSRGYGTFIIWHENAPERYRNAHFGYAVKAGSTCGYRVVATSNSFDARTCDNRVNLGDLDGDGDIDDNDLLGTTDGTSYITFELWSDPDKACTFDIDRIMTSGNSKSNTARVYTLAVT